MVFVAVPVCFHNAIIAGPVSGLFSAKN